MDDEVLILGSAPCPPLEKASLGMQEYLKNGGGLACGRSIHTITAYELDSLPCCPV